MQLNPSQNDQLTTTERDKDQEDTTGTIHKQILDNILPPSLNQPDTTYSKQLILLEQGSIKN